VLLAASAAAAALFCFVITVTKLTPLVKCGLPYFNFSQKPFSKKVI